MTAGIMYSDLSFDPQNLSIEKALDDEVDRFIPKPIPLSNSTASIINQDQSFAALKPIPAREVTAKGIVNGAPTKLCARAGVPGEAPVGASRGGR